MIADAPVAPTGSLRIAASFDGRRTVIDTMRQEGLSKCSRPFAEPDGSARLVTSQLGPGFVRGDRYALDVAIGARASLVLAAQAASRASGRGTESSFEAKVTVGAEGRFISLGEPLISFDGACHRARTNVSLASGASIAWLDAFAHAGAGSSLRSTLRVEIAGCLALHDAVALTAHRSEEAIASAAYVRAGMTNERQTELLAYADDVALAHARPGTIVGIGAPRCGVSLRARGPHARDARAVLHAILQCVYAADRSRTQQ